MLVYRYTNRLGKSLLPAHTQRREETGLTASPICTFIHSFQFWHFWIRSCNIFLLPYLTNKRNYSVYICIRVTASPIQWTWTWANSGRWWRTGRPGVLQSVGLQRVDTTGQLDNFSENSDFIYGYDTRVPWTQDVYVCVCMLNMPTHMGAHALKRWEVKMWSVWDIFQD